MAFHVNYSAIDRFIHRLAFASPAVQFTAADIEKAVFGSQYRGFTAAKPVFITSLPRAGTTALLEAFSKLPLAATHLYRDMPFVLAPMVWARMSGGFRTDAQLRERAHGDGVMVGEDSPEAFEEILWQTIWPEKYSSSQIALWYADDDTPDARAFFADHMKKIVALRRPDRANDGRYISKNNANVARLGLMPRMFPDAKIVVPVREPISHAQSLLRQHRNFLGMHEQEPFVRRYMSDIGHFEFGHLHRPIAFPGLRPLIDGRDPMTLDYWLAYWIAAFEYVREHSDAIIAVSYEALCESPREELQALLARLEIDDEGTIDDVSRVFKSAPMRQDVASPIDPVLCARATELYSSPPYGSMKRRP